MTIGARPKTQRLHYCNARKTVHMHFTFNSTVDSNNDQTVEQNDIKQYNSEASICTVGYSDYTPTLFIVSYKLI